MSRPRVNVDHGQYGYAQRHGCPCEPCRKVVRRYAKRRNYDNATGNPRTVEAGPVREHVQFLMEAGVSTYQISRVTGQKVKHSQVNRLLYGNQATGKPVEFMYAHTAELLLAVTAQDALAQPGFTSPVGTRRRIQALAARGYNKDEIGAAIGVSGSAIFNWVNRDRITTESAQKMKDAYDELCMGEGTSATMRWRALREGWAPPLAWDEHTIDDPEAEPDRSAIKCAVKRCGKPCGKGALCRQHHDVVSRMGGYAGSRQFRLAVLSLTDEQTHDHQSFLAGLKEMRAFGLTPEEAAQRMGRGVKYVRKNWHKVA